MNDFDFISPTKIIFGRGRADEVGSVISSYGFKRALLVYGGGSIKKTGLYDRVVRALDEKGIAHEELSGVRANPEKGSVVAGVRLAKDFKADIILAVGGGSVIDVAKAISVGVYYDGDPFDFNLHKAVPKKALPVGVVLTIASAGSESSNSCVINDDATHIKQGFNNDIIRPLFAIEDPELTFTVSKRQTAAGIADIMMHSLERYFNESGPYEIADDWALSLCKEVMSAGRKAIENPTDYDARAALMLLSSLSHDGLTSIGKTSVFTVHPLEHALSGYRSDIIHGEGIAVCYLGWARYAKGFGSAKLARLARELFDIDCPDDDEAAIIGIDSMRGFYVSLGMPTALGQLGLSESDIDALADLATGNGTRVVGRYPQPLDREAVKQIYRLCL
jgi:alcohol dehydrogenase YqhD (iron-dependent ADH family)